MPCLNKQDTLKNFEQTGYFKKRKMFKFDFRVEDCDNIAVCKPLTEPNTDRIEVPKEIDWYDSQEVEINQEILENIDVFQLNSVTLSVGNINLNYIASSYLLQNISSTDETTKDITKAEQNHTDLIPGVYEGGAKVWECTHDLLNYMDESYEPAIFGGNRVLDLGCGSGLLGIYAYKCGAQVQFQDYNRDVLEKVTIPNVILNVPTLPERTDLALKTVKSRVRFYCGDWSKYTELTEKDEKFDVIMTSETIYNPDNQQKLLNTINAKLATTGVVLMAAKTYYFGIGGGLRSFEEIIAKDGRFHSTVLWKSTGGISREILELKRKL